MEARILGIERLRRGVGDEVKERMGDQSIQCPVGHL